MNFEATTVAELRAALIKSGKYTVDEANELKGKTNLVLAVKKLMSDGLIDSDESVEEESVDVDDTTEEEVEVEEVDGISEELQLEPEEVVEAESLRLNKELVPQVYSDEWQEYVMKQLRENEFVEIQGNKYPKVVGLRRLVRMLLGEIVFSGPTAIFPATSANENGRASVLYEVRIAAHDSNPYVDIGSELPINVFSACAEAWEGNITDERFRPYPLPIAETRAEGRALRKALYLNTLTAEELSGSEMPTKETVNAAVEEYNENDPISGNQINVIKVKCKQLNIDVDKFAPNVEALLKKDGVELLKKLNNFQRGEEKVPSEVLKG